MKLARIGRRSLALLIAAALVAIVASTVAFASRQDRDHPHFLPSRFSGAPEISAVVLNPQTNTFVQLVFDRGLDAPPGRARLDLQRRLPGDRALGRGRIGRRG